MSIEKIYSRLVKIYSCNECPNNIARHADCGVYEQRYCFETGEQIVVDGEYQFDVTKKFPDFCPLEEVEQEQ